MGWVAPFLTPLTSFNRIGWAMALALAVAAAGDGPGIPGDLRRAIRDAYRAGGTNTIVFATTSNPLITLGGPLPPIASNRTVDGGFLGNVIIDGAGASRVFFVDTGNVTLGNLVIRHALALGGAGADLGGGGAGLFVNQATASVILISDFFSNCTVRGGKG
jgi:hypothetical protein